MFHTTLYVRPRAQTTSRKTTRAVGPMTLMFVIFGFCLLVGVSKVGLENQTFKMGLQWEEVDRDLKQVLSEQDNLIMQREHYTRGDYILPKAEALDMRPATSGQIRRMYVAPHGDEVSSANTFFTASQE